jgi:hypothetical protein
MQEWTYAQAQGDVPTPEELQQIMQDYARWV